MAPFDSSAFVDAPTARAPATTEPAQADTIAARMRELFGPNGEHWHKHQLRNRSGTKFCLIGAALKVEGLEINLTAWDFCPSKAALEKAVGDLWVTIPSFNDWVHTTYRDVLRVLDRMEKNELAERVRAEGAK